ncbi:DUF7261 family protein [Natronorubrum sp. DTA7]|uniref:DUF7261 family protein n=1 Tax=Natronorubrum sp. DTA7 TaxID=3447016 RepID=UPI003F843C87
MVNDNSFTQRPTNDQQPDDTPDRGQVILVGAITLAFIILGVVVVFNGVLYTETLSSADTGQSASTAEKTELEITQGVSCLIVETNDEVGPGDPDALNSTLEDELQEFNEMYQNAAAESSPTVVNISLAETEISPITDILETVTVMITYDSNDISYEQERTIRASDCPAES